MVKLQTLQVAAPSHTTRQMSFFWEVSSWLLLLLCESDSMPSVTATCLNITVTSSPKRLPTVLICPAEPGGAFQAVIIVSFNRVIPAMTAYVLTKEQLILLTFSAPDSESLFHAHSGKTSPDNKAEARTSADR